MACSLVWHLGWGHQRYKGWRPSVARYRCVVLDRVLPFQKPYGSFMKSLSKTPLQFDVGSLLKVIMEKKGRMSPYHLKAIPLQAGFENGWIPYSWPYLHTKFIWCSLWGGRVGAIYMGGASAVLGLLLGAAATWWNSMTGYGLNLEMTLQ